MTTEWAVLQATAPEPRAGRAGQYGGVVGARNRITEQL
jgi:hypothetical protein